MQRSRAVFLFHWRYSICPWVHFLSSGRFRVSVDSPFIYYSAFCAYIYRFYTDSHFRLCMSACCLNVFVRYEFCYTHSPQIIWPLRCLSLGVSAIAFKLKDFISKRFLESKKGSLNCNTWMNYKWIELWYNYNTGRQSYLKEVYLVIRVALLEKGGFMRTTGYHQMYEQSFLNGWSW